MSNGARTAATLSGVQAATTAAGGALQGPACRLPALFSLALPPPVPYVFLASCTAHRCPIMAACWSPRQPAIGTPFSGPSAVTSLQGQAGRQQPVNKGILGGLTRVWHAAKVGKCTQRSMSYVRRCQCHPLPKATYPAQPHHKTQPLIPTSPPGSPIHLCIAADLRQHVGSHPKQAQRGLMPGQRCKLHQVCAASIADVGEVQPAARSPACRTANGRTNKQAFKQGRGPTNCE